MKKELFEKKGAFSKALIRKTLTKLVYEFAMLSI